MELQVVVYNTCFYWNFIVSDYMIVSYKSGISFSRSVDGSVRRWETMGGHLIFHRWCFLRFLLSFSFARFYFHFVFLVKCEREMLSEMYLYELMIPIIFFYHFGCHRLQCCLFWIQIFFRPCHFLHSESFLIRFIFYSVCLCFNIFHSTSVQCFDQMFH